MKNIEITKDYTLNAVWKEKDTPTYNICFDTLNGNDISCLSLKENEVLENLPIPQKTGYQFENWLYQNKVINTLKVTQNMTLIAKYQKTNND